MSYEPNLWRYPVRTLTTLKFPFWSEIINQQAGNVSVPALSSADIHIQPPAGETWLVCIDAVMRTAASGSFVEYLDSGSNPHLECDVLGTYGLRYPLIHVCKILTNTLYGWLHFQSYDSAAVDAYYGYSGFELSKRFYEISRGRKDKPIWVKPTAREIPPNVPGWVGKYVMKRYNIRKHEYELVVVPVKDLPIAVNKDNYPVERITIWAELNTFMNKILKPVKEGTEDPKKMGWEQYFRIMWGKGTGIRLTGASNEERDNSQGS